MAKYRKSRAFSPAGFFECEGKGLKWLGAARAQGGPRVAEVYGWGDGHLDIERIAATSPTAQAATAFGAALARMHDAGAEYFGSAPEGYDGVCYFGPLQDPVPMDTGEWTDPISYLAEGRLLPMVEMGIRRGTLDRGDLELTQRVIDALPDIMGRAADDKPARIHGDLWSGNVMWTADTGETEAVLIDPAAHGGHREEDLAMLHLFGMSYLTQIIEGYQSVHPLKAGYQERTTLWQLYPIAGHCVFFGGGYVSEYRAMCRSLL
ncbi:fructosamine kinase family protein [Bifidobacterium eulemuris]|uniref:Fructosamine kinase n=1 Tax=Bifidobacterium eulemuris TaxID=1765219 RepID=A0A261GCP2_9BIFI|nr:fructosamine kinase family protein [Bifidobacterium eulemuris]OZG69184.1 fructosamine kinase [Bifidobacterium eulemuris]QOL31303.1 fructosamine kinase family protein [Bifidobacterium eulemuris]